jgi:hypothetical protein
MAIKLNQAAVERAKYLIKAGEFESFDSSWDEEKPNQTEIDYFIGAHDMKEYGNWFLGKNDQFDSELPEHYEYPIGDLKEVQRCALVYSLSRAEEKKYREIAQAARELIEFIDNRTK